MRTKWDRAGGFGMQGTDYGSDLNHEWGTLLPGFPVDATQLLATTGRPGEPGWGADLRALSGYSGEKPVACRTFWR